MADERDPQVSRRYRELGADEPPAALDESILAAARRPLSPRRWYVPLAAAAVAVFAIAVTFQVERRQPDPQQVPEVAPAAKPDELPLKAHPGTEQRDAVIGVERPKAPPRPLSPPRSARTQAQESPERWLERIAGLRAQGRHDEADQALAEFRQRHPGYRIPERLDKK